MKLIVSGCSVTHGAELYNNFMHPENIKLSYSQQLANKLDCELINVALSAASNEYIFHSVISELTQYTDIHSILVMWTSTGRLYWKTNNRHYFFLGNFASSMIDLVNFNMHDKKIDNCWFTGDSDEIVDKIAKFHKFVVTDYFDVKEEFQKLHHYKLALTAVCENRNIKLINLSWNDIQHIGSWKVQSRHPNIDEHREIANMIYGKYYEIKQ
jgi:hypothetical protein